MAALRAGRTTRIVNAARLRIKESDRLATVTQVLMAAVAAIRCRGPVTITGAQCVQKSYPNFWDDYEKLGGHLTREDHI